MPMSDGLAEANMLVPVMRLFPKSRYHRVQQVAFGRKKIDLLCFPRQGRGKSASVELKLRDWRRALWQALINLQMADRSYIALWHEYVHRAVAHVRLLDTYGVGLISVGPQRARFVRHARDHIYRIAREH